MSVDGYICLSSTELVLFLADSLSRRVKAESQQVHEFLVRTMLWPVHALPSALSLAPVTAFRLSKLGLVSTVCGY